jgi:thiosulfate/3-mercaptopyruvate sulfurtransferase
MLKASGHGPVLVLDGPLEAVRAAGMPWTDAPTPPPVPRDPYPVRAWALPTVDIDQAAAFASDPDRILIDVRAPERWRGEVEPIDPIAGRIPGSVNFFLQRNLTAEGRFRSIDELAELYRPLVEHRSPGTVAVHCGSGVSACHTLFALHEIGFDGAALYVGSFSQWCRSGRSLGRGVS